MQLGKGSGPGRGGVRQGKGSAGGGGGLNGAGGRVKNE